MGVTRIVPNLPMADVARTNALYARVFGLDVRMDLGWIGNLSPAEAPAVQLHVMTRDESAPCHPTISVGVAAPAEVDAIHERGVAAGLEVVHPLADEEWGSVSDRVAGIGGYLRRRLKGPKRPSRPGDSHPGSP